MDRNVLIKILQQEGNLKHCFSHDEIERLAAHLSIETVQAEIVLMKKGETFCSMVFILDGLVQVIDGERQLTIEKPGSIVGEVFFLTRQHALQILELSSRQRLDDFQLTTSKTFSTKTSHLP